MNLKMMTWISAGLVAGTAWAADPAGFKDEKEKVSYSVGVSLGKTWKSRDIDFNLDQLLKGIKDGMSGGKILLTEAEMQGVLSTYEQELRGKQMERAKVVGEKNKKEGDAFLAANKLKTGIKTLPSGLQYEVLKEGTGETPKITDQVTTQYRGTLIDGTEFDSSYKRNEPLVCSVGGVIKGWTEALQLMKIGSKWKLYIPSDLAYGVAGAAPIIGPNAVLIFEMELLGINKAAKTP